MSVSFSPYALVAFPLLFILVLRWPKKSCNVIEDSRVGIFRRYFAFNVDFMVGMLGVLPFICMVGLTLEFIVTGEWVWSFERDYFRWTDVIGSLAFFVGFYGIYYYIKWHFKYGKQTLGQYLLGFKLLPASDDPKLGIRYLVAWVIGAWWIFWPWTIFGKKQDYLWDEVSKTKARMVKPV